MNNLCLSTNIQEEEFIVRASQLFPKGHFINNIVEKFGEEIFHGFGKVFYEFKDPLKNFKKVGKQLLHRFREGFTNFPVVSTTSINGSIILTVPWWTSSTSLTSSPLNQQQNHKHIQINQQSSQQQE
jgi:hypothetical protein